MVELPFPRDSVENLIVKKTFVGVNLWECVKSIDCY